MSDINETAHAVAAIVARSRRVRAGIEETRENMRRYLPGDLVELSFHRAICHPFLGGILRKNKKYDIPGPSFTVNSLRLAAKKGELRTSWNGENQFTCAAALRDWIALRTGERPMKTNVVKFRPPAIRTNHEKQQGSASVARALAALDATPSTLNIRKKGR